MKHIQSTLIIESNNWVDMPDKIHFIADIGCADPGAKRELFFPIGISWVRIDGIRCEFDIRYQSQI